ncbi:MAG: hypothetical protein ABI037_12100 [Gemmatimonadales bacterium]
MRTLHIGEFSKISVAGMELARRLSELGAPRHLPWWGRNADGQPTASRARALVRSAHILQALLMAFAIALGLLWVGVTVSIVRQLVGWWVALEYAGWTATTQWPQW